MALPTRLTRLLYRRKLTRWLKPGLAERFDLVCHDNPWGSGETVSGPGSERASGCVLHVTRLLDPWIDALGVRSMADIGCGDLNWQADYLSRRPELDYTGYDVSPAVLALNRQRHPSIKTLALDISRAAPGPCDLILCKDVLNLLEEADVHRALANLVRSDARWLLITSNGGAGNGQALPRHPHASRHLDLQAPPYDLPPPLYGDHYLLLYRLDDLRAHFRGERLDTFEETDCSKRFTHVFEDRLWGSKESASGPGSERDSASVAHALQQLDQILREHRIRSMADIPCGDFNWMPALLSRHPGLIYTGYDVVPALVRENQARHPQHRFQALDVTRTPPAHAELIFSKDLLNHLSEAEVWAALQNMAASGADWLLVTTNRGFENVDLDPALPHASRHLNLEAPPYDLPEPVAGDHYLLLYRMETIARHLARRRPADVVSA